MTKQSLPARPEIDVIIPVYNGQAYIRDALASVEAQTLKPKKIIIVDDGSTDHTAQIINSYHSLIPVQYVRKTNGGLSSARNHGLRKVESAYVAFLDADDAWLPEKLEAQWEVFAQSHDPKLGVVYCGYRIMDARGQDRNDFYIYPIDRRVRGDVFSHNLEKNRIAGSGSGVLVKYMYFQQAGFFDETLIALEDWDMWLRLSQVCHFDFADRVLVKIRRHPSNMQRNHRLMFENFLRFFNKWVDRLPPSYPVPTVWVRRILAYRWSHPFDRSVIQNIKTILSPAAQRVMLAITRQRLLFYVCLRLLALPVTLFRRPTF